MKNERIKEIKIDGEVIYLKKDLFGWRVVYPIFKNNKLNWRNLLIGNARSILLLVLFLFLFLFYIYSVKDILIQCKSLINDPCSFCNKKWLIRK